MFTLSSIVNTSLVLAMFLIVFAVIYYLLNYKNIGKRKKYYEDLHRNLKPGKRIEFCGGIYGNVTKVDKDTLEVMVSKDNIITISRYVVTKIMD
ncbi:preprotein translocase subunit YajC [Criibacterium bergeronii]|uniref:Preprotein translocase subunit YajC n=1 Tax=Criibacterium bergeronii TaxID=1871336 RepID=A0A552VBZ8_9FIRM|nr:preprotein translocase subunit YajC [Criibacterium bergeronii]MBS6062712.1 preprotein translocase subunit YajC [Peptostreptococcaceae bacterium]TRW28014.1 preprotein translocase subunit YajC [Criibacterium bergeronii]